MKRVFLLFLIYIIIGALARENGHIRRLKSIVSTSDANDVDKVHEVNSTVSKTMTKFSCISEIDGAELLVYGTKAWMFPEQDINLTLTYPPNFHDENDDYTITGFRVLLFVDTINSRGYINSGGLFEDNLSLSFISPKVKMLFYQFWLYGIPKVQTIYETSYILYDLC